MGRREELQHRYDLFDSLLTINLVLDGEFQ